MKPSAPARARLRKAGRAIGGDVRGAAALEFAIVAPVLIAFLFGTLEVGRVMHRSSTVQWAIERAARTAMIDANVTQAELQTRVEDYLARQNETLTVDLEYEVVEESGASVGRVRAQYAHQFLLPVFPGEGVTFTLESYIPTL